MCFAILKSNLGKSSPSAVLESLAFASSRERMVPFYEMESSIERSL